MTEIFGSGTQEGGPPQAALSEPQPDLSRRSSLPSCGGGHVATIQNPDREGGARWGAKPYHRDDLYNVVAVTDASGNVVERYEYDDFGRPTIMDPQGNPRATSAIGNALMFQGRQYDPETGFYWYRTRYYDPRAGRFTSRDSIGIWGDPLNLGNGYTFVGNNPWTLWDPYGLGFWDTAGDVYNGVGVGLYGVWDGISSLTSEAWEKNENPLAMVMAGGITRAEQVADREREFGDMGPVEAAVHGWLVVGADVTGVTAFKDVADGQTEDGREIKGAEGVTAHLTPVIATYALPLVCKGIGYTARSIGGKLRARGLMLNENLPSGVAGRWRPGSRALEFSRPNVYRSAKYSGRSIRMEAARTAYHEAFHRAIYPIDRAVGRLFGKADIYTASLRWAKFEEYAAEAYGATRAFLRETINLK